VFDVDEPDEPETYEGVDYDGKVRVPPFAGRFAAPDMSMMATTGVLRDPKDERAKSPGAIARSPFAR
jgi:hypothetical protein